MGKWSVSEVMRLKKVGKEEEEEATCHRSITYITEHRCDGEKNGDHKLLFA